MAAQRTLPRLLHSFAAHARSTSGQMRQTVSLGKHGTIMNILRAYQPSVRKYRWLLLATLISLFAVIFLDTLYPYLIRSLVDVITAETPDTEAAWSIFWSFVYLYIATIFFYRIFDISILLFEPKVMRDLDARSFAAIERQSIRFFENTFSGSLVKRVSRFRNAFEGITDAFFFEIGRDIIMIAFVFGIFFFELPALAAAFGIWTFFFIVISIGLTLLKFPLDTKNAESDTMVGGALSDSFSNHATVKAYGEEQMEQERFRVILNINYIMRIRAWFAGAGISALQSIMMFAFQLTVIWWLIRGWEEGTIGVGDVVFFQSYIVWLFAHLWGFGNTVRRVFQHLADAEEMATDLNRIPEVLDAPAALKLIVRKGGILYENVSFSYIDPEKRERHDVQDFTLDIKPGQTFALVGRTGAGKSTIIKLLLRFFDLYRGRILIDGQDIASVTQESLRSRTALVPQQPELFHRTIRDNISFARPNATEAEIIDAARRAQALEFIERFPQRFDTIVGERGVKLSGGERQRIAIARAFLANAPILLLDEATSALDSRTELMIQQAISELLRGRTSIAIAHRLSTIMRADRIIVMDHGSIIEEGTHSELIAKSGTYAELWSHQSCGYLEDE